MPTAEACFFFLNLPDFDSAEILRSRLNIAIKYCGGMNGDTVHNLDEDPNHMQARDEADRYNNVGDF